MTVLKKGTPLYDEMFAGVSLPTSFESLGPHYSTIRNGFLDPSNKDLLLNPKVTNAGQSKDIRTGVQLAVRELAVDYGDGLPPNFPSALLPALRTTLASADISPTLTDTGVDKIFAAVAKGDGAAAIGATIGVVMTGLQIALPVVGSIASAIVAFGAGIYAVVSARKDKLDQEKADDRALLYQSFPPLQVEDGQLDTDLVNKILIPQLREPDWTNLFMPRFDGADWVGIEREGGYAFAPGKRGTNWEKFGGTDAFVPSAGRGLGVLPGTDQVTAVVQVSLVHDPAAGGSEAWRAFTEGGKDPRGIDKFGVKGWTRVHDTGMYYPATGRLAASMWSLATARGNPYKYRLDAARMHAAWKTWAEGGLRYIREVCYPWFTKNSGQFKYPKDSQFKGELKIDPYANLEGFFGTGVFEAVGAWACGVNGGTTTQPHYDVYPAPYGLVGPELAANPFAYGHPDSSLSSMYSGSFLPILDGAAWPDKCMGTIYDRGTDLAATLSQLQQAQRWELRNTLVCAYCSERDAAFAGAKVDGKKVGGDPKLLDELRKVRAILLESEERFALDLDDVPVDEPGIQGKGLYWENWRKQLAAVGVTSNPKPSKGKKGPTGEDATPPPPPARFVPGRGNPWEPQAPMQAELLFPEDSGGGGGLVIALGGLGLAGLGLGLLRSFANRKATRRGLVGAGSRR